MKSKFIFGLLKAAIFIILCISYTFAKNYPHNQSEVSVSVEAEPKSYTGVCPVEVKFTVEFNTTLFSQKVEYRIVRSDGEIGEPKTIILNRATPKKVIEKWTVNQDYSGWLAVKIISPIKMESNKAEFSVKCTGMVFYFKPDLTVNFKGPASAKQGENLTGKYKIIVKNSGSKEARNFYVDIKLIGKVGTDPSSVIEHSCGRGFVSMIQPGGTAVPVGLFPSIPSDFPIGNYQLCAIVDSMEMIDESNENNNRVCQSITILKK